jgi:CHAT domain/MalT-like TPR region
MDVNTFRHLRGEAMRDFDDGELPKAEGEVTTLLAQTGEPADPLMAGEIALCYQDRATLRRFSNRWQEALDDLSQSERIAMKLPFLPRQMTLPNVYYVRALMLGNPNTSVYDAAAAAGAIGELRKYGGPAWRADSVDADLAFNQRQWDKAAGLYQSVADALEQEGWKQAIAGCRARAGECFVELNDLTAAEREIEASLKFLEKSGPPDMLASARLSLARIRLARGEHDEAWELALPALSGMEGLVRHFRDVFEQQRYLADKLRFYDRAFEIALAKGGEEGQWRAWSIVERAKSFYLCQLVANAEIRLFEGMDPAEVARLESFDEQLDALERRYAQLSEPEKEGERGEELGQRIKSVSEEKRDLLGELMKQNPRWAALKAPPPVDIRRELKRLEAHWIVVSYFWVAERDGDGACLHIFWTGADRMPHAQAVKWTAEEIKALDGIRLHLRGNVDAEGRTFPRSLAGKFLPMELLESLGESSQMLISPHERLKGLPLHSAPMGGGQQLIEKVPVQYIPSLTLLSLQSRTVTADEILLLGCPRNGFGDVALKDVDTEIASLGEIWKAARPGKVKERILAAEAEVKKEGLGPEEWGGFGILHFACHGVFKEGMPFDAALRLGSESIRASELFGAQLGNASVFLSACSLGQQEDGSGKPTAGDEWIGLYLPMFYAGALQLMVSLYEADSETARRVMVEMHTALSKGVALARAFQAAVKVMISEGRPTTLWANWYLVGLPT